MIKFAPLVGLLLASPVVLDALMGRRPVEQGLLAWLTAIAVSAVGLWLLDQSMKTSPPARRTEDHEEPSSNGSPGGRRRDDVPPE